MDLQINQTVDGFKNHLYEKEWDLYQYLPLHSCYAPGVMLSDNICQSIRLLYNGLVA